MTNKQILKKTNGGAVSSTSDSVSSGCSKKEQKVYHNRLKKMAGKNGKWVKVWGRGYELMFPI